MTYKWIDRPSVYLFGLVVIASALWMQIAPFSGYDIWWHFRVGRDIMENGLWPFPDMYSYTAGGVDWATHQWLASCMLWLAYDVAGEFGPWMVRVVTHALTLLLLARLASRRGIHWSVVGLLVLVEAHSLAFRSVRPQVFTPLFLAILLSVLDRSQTKRLNLPILGAVLVGIALWGNLHGGFSFGVSTACLFLLLADYRLGARHRGADGPEKQDAPALMLRLILVVAACLFGAMNPEGVMGYAKGPGHLGTPTSDWRPVIPFTNVVNMTPLLWLALAALTVSVVVQCVRFVQDRFPKQDRYDFAVALLFLILSNFSPN